MSDPDEPIDPEAFAMKVPLTSVFGTHPKTLLVSALLTESPDPETNFSVNELSRISGLDADTVREQVTELQATGIVLETDELKDEPAYKLDDDMAAVDTIETLSDQLFELTS